MRDVATSDVVADVNGMTVGGDLGPVPVAAAAQVCRARTSESAVAAKACEEVASRNRVERGVHDGAIASAHAERCLSGLVDEAKPVED